MAASDAKPIPRKNQAYRLTFGIFDADGDLVTGAAGLDTEVSKDGGTFADATNEATEIATNSGVYYLDLTSTEMNADTVAVITKTSTTGAKTTLTVITPEEAGDIKVDVEMISGGANAADNLESYCDGTTPMPVNATQISGDGTAADNLEAACDGTGYNLGGGAIRFPAPWFSGSLSAVTSTTEVTVGALGNENAAFVGATLVMTSGQGNGQCGIVESYNHTTGVLTLEANHGLTMTPGIGDEFVIVFASTGQHAAHAVWEVPRSEHETESTFGGGVRLSNLAITAEKVAADVIGSDQVSTAAVTKIQSGLATSSALSTASTNITTLLNRVGAFTGSGVNTVLGFLKACLSKTASTPSDVGGTFDPATDSQEAIRDNQSTSSAPTAAAIAAQVLTGTTLSELVTGECPAEPNVSQALMLAYMKERNGATAGKTTRTIRDDSGDDILSAQMTNTDGTFEAGKLS